MQKGATGKSNQADTVALQLVNQILRREFDTLQSVRRHVVGKHAARRVHRDEQIETFALYILERVTPARLSQADDRADEAEQLQTETQGAAKSIHRPRELR